MSRNATGRGERRLAEVQKIGKTIPRISCDLDHSEVGLRVASDEFRFKFFSIRKEDVELCRPTGDMVICQDVTACINDDPRTYTFNIAIEPSRRIGNAKEITEKGVILKREGRAYLFLACRDLDVDNRWYVFFATWMMALLKSAGRDLFSAAREREMCAKTKMMLKRMIENILNSRTLKA